ncbi:DUF4097 family beta strand repeat-containing protein [Fusibacter bizertensis]
MKRTLTILTLVILSLSMSACTYLTKEENKIPFFDNTLDKKVSFAKDLSDYDKIELNIDLTVSEVNLDVSSDHQLKFDQAANREELLATADYKEKGDTLIITFKNEKKLNIIAGTQTSKTEILIPEGIEVILDTNTDVGAVKINTKDILYTEITCNANVGDIDIYATKSQDQLSYINLSTDVGDLNVNLDKGAEKLETVELKSNTGGIKSSLKGTYSQPLALSARTDVGDINLKTSGDFEAQVEINAKSSVGDVTISVPENHEVKLKPTLTEFTSSLNIKDIPFNKSKGVYAIEGNKSNFEIDLTVTVGDATILYAK